MMYDFRDYRDIVKDAVDAVNQSANWKWTARVNKSEIKLYNGYIKGEYTDCPDYFSIKVFDCKESGALIEGRDCMEEMFIYLIPGEGKYEDGSIERCIEEAVREANRYFESRY